VRLARQEWCVAVEASRSGSGSDELVFLIAQTQKLVAIYDKRWSDADAQGSAVLTAAVTLAALIVTASATLPVRTTWLVVVALVGLSVSAGFAVWERTGAGLRLRRSFGRDSAGGGLSLSAGFAVWERTRLRLRTSFGRDSAGARSDQLKPWVFSHDTQDYHDAVEAFQALSPGQTDPSPEAITLQLWRKRVDDVRHVARSKERWAGAAGLMLVLAVIAVAALAISLVVNHVR
jgi:hypothetical protein